MGLEKYTKLFCERVRDGIYPAAASQSAPFLPVLNSFQPFVSTADVSYRTTRPVVSLVKSHLNLAPYDSKWELDAIDILEELDFVEAFTPNDRNIGLAIRYQYLDQKHTYEPDFVVRLRNKKLVMLEIKGRGGEIRDPDRVLAKNAAARKWVAAVNCSERFGDWAFEICRDLNQLRRTLADHVKGTMVLPFRYVEPEMGQHFKTCVPLTSLRAAASRWSDHQTSLVPADWSEEWVTWDEAPRFSTGMFVARVQGASMEPLIPSGSYCLFRPPPAGSRQGRRLLVAHDDIRDPEGGGAFTLKVYSSEKRAVEDGGWEHSQIILKPLNPAFEPIVLSAADASDVRVVAEFVSVIPGSAE